MRPGAVLIVAVFLLASASPSVAADPMPLKDYIPPAYLRAPMQTPGADKVLHSSDPVAQYNLANKLLTDRELVRGSDSERLLTVAAYEDYVPALMAFVEYWGISDGSQDHRTWVLWCIQRAAMLGDAQGQFLYGELEATGTNGVPQNRQEGVAYLQKSSDQGYYDATELLSKLRYEDTKRIVEPIAIGLALVATVAGLIFLRWRFGRKLKAKLGEWKAEHKRRSLERAELRAAEEKKRTEMATIEAAALERFPIYLFPRIKREHAVFMFGKDIALNFQDWDWEFWAKLLELYPEPPRSEEARKAAEDKLWQDEASKHVVEEHGRPALKSKYDVIDHWWAMHRWFPRRYFAATGGTVPELWSRKILEAYEITYEHRDRKGYDTTMLSERQQLQSVERASDDISRFGHEEVPAYRERWGEWYFVNVEKAFKRAFSGDGEQSDAESPLGDARVATAEEARTASSASIHRSGVHNQQF